MTTGLETDVLSLLFAIHNERPYPLADYAGDAMIHALSVGLISSLHDGDAHVEGRTVLIWKDFELTDAGLALVDTTLLGV